MPEGLSPSEVGKEIAEHARHAEHATAASLHRHARAISIAEAVLLSIVALTAAWSGYAAAKWSTESSLQLANASATRAKANRAYQGSLTLRSQDAANFNAWFTAELLGSRRGARVAQARFRPQYAVAFNAWLKTKPFTNENAPKGPQFMAEYRPTGAAAAKALDARADAFYAEGEHAAVTGDKYIRITVILASVLFLVGLSSHFPLTGIRIGLVLVGAALLIFAASEIAQLPRPPA
jgi:hypothetical protein